MSDDELGAGQSQCVSVERKPWGLESTVGTMTKE
jgi:hypothetical protein